MMYPRLRLLHKLLQDNGVIFISIDDNELYNLKAICDEIMGSNCFVADISWQRTYSMRNDVKGIAAETEHILVYGKQPQWQPKKLQRTEEMDSKYKNPDNDPRGAWRNIVASAPNAATHQGMVYAIQNPITGEYAYPPQGRCWSLGQDQMLDAMNKWCKYKLEDIRDDEKRAEMCGVSVQNIRKDVCAIVLDEDIDVAKAKAVNIYENAVLPEFYFSRKGFGALSRKAYINEVGGRPVTNFWSFEETGHTDEASRLLKAIFNGTAVFDTPKPPRLIERILHIATEESDIILDSFAGSGTTAHATLLMNQNTGHRKFILIEMLDYADSITAERVKRVISGYGEGKNAVKGTGGNFSFYDLGDTLLLPDGNLNEDVGEAKIRDYIWYTETKEPMTDDVSTDEPYCLGTSRDTAYYFYYKKDEITTLDYDFLSTVKTKAAGYIIYADLCTISDEELKKWNITFKKIPRDIAKV